MKSIYIFLLAVLIPALPACGMQRETVILSLGNQEAIALYNQLSLVRTFFGSYIMRAKSEFPAKYIEKTIDQLLLEQELTVDRLKLLKSRGEFFITIITRYLGADEKHLAEIGGEPAVVSRDFYITEMAEFIRTVCGKIKALDPSCIMTPNPPMNISPDKPESTPKVEQPAGLKNIGNNCFMNAVLQSLSTMPAFTKLVCEKSWYIPGSLADEYQKFLRFQKQSSQNVVNPAELCMRGWNMLNMPTHTAQAADEYLILTLDQLTDGSIKPAAKQELKEKNRDNYTYAGTTQPKTDISALFYSLTSSQFIHKPTNYASEKKLEAQGILSLSLSKTDSTLQPKSTLQTKSTLRECLDTYFAPSKIDQYELPNKEKVTAEAANALEETGQYLIIQLKRLIDPTTRIEEKISFPLEGLDLSSYYADKQKRNPYKLIAVIMHCGGAFGGHYTAYVLKDGWFALNDAEASKIDLNEMRAIGQRGYGYSPTHLPTVFIYERMPQVV